MCRLQCGKSKFNCWERSRREANRSRTRRDEKLRTELSVVSRSCVITNTYTGNLRWGETVFLETGSVSTHSERHDWILSIGAMGKQKDLEKTPVSAPLWLPHISHGMTWARSRSYEARIQKLNTWATVRSPIYMYCTEQSRIVGYHMSLKTITNIPQPTSNTQLPLWSFALNPLSDKFISPWLSCISISSSKFQTNWRIFIKRDTNLIPLDTI